MFQNVTYRIVGMFGGGKVGKFGESTVIRQTLDSQILAGNSILMAKNLSIPQTLFRQLATFDSAICQTLP